MDSNNTGDKADSRRRVIRKVIWFLISFSLGVSIVLVFQRVQSFNENLRVFGTCHSDYICLYLNPLKTYATENGGNLPDPETLDRIVLASGYAIPKCPACHKEFRINGDLGQINLDDEENRLLIWCPLEGHRHWAAAIFLRDNELSPEVISLSELEKAMEKELSATSPKRTE
jgi:hypothetical protein